MFFEDKKMSVILPSYIDIERSVIRCRLSLCIHSRHEINHLLTSLQNTKYASWSLSVVVPLKVLKSCREEAGHVFPAPIGDRVLLSAHIHWLPEMSVIAFSFVFMTEYGMLSVGGMKVECGGR